MEVASDILGVIDGAILTAGSAFFQNTAIAISPFVTIAMTLLLIILGANMSLNVFQLSTRDTVQIMLRMVLVLLFGMSWANFNTIYVAITDGLQSLALSFFAVASGDTISANEAMDKFGANMANTADGVIAAQGSLTRGVIGALLFFILSALTACYVVIVAFAKIALAILLGIAPLAVLATIFNSTRNLFESWLSAFVGYAMYPVAAAAVIGTVTVASDGFFVKDTAVGTLGQIVSFLVVSIVGIISFRMIPTIASNITGQFNLGSVTPQALSIVAGPTKAAAGYTARGAKEIYSGARHGKTSRQAAYARDKRNVDRGQEIKRKIAAKATLLKHK